MILRRIVFGEPKPGGAAFSALLAGLDESVSYCNRSGPLQHDRVTDLPFAIPLLGLDFEHPAPLSFVRADPPDSDPYGIFAWHHSALYLQGARAALQGDHVEAARLCDAIYDRGEPEPWNVGPNEDSGVVWAIRREGSKAFVVFRGSITKLDWLRDIISIDPAQTIKRIMHHDTFGTIWGGFLIGVPEAWEKIAGAIGDASEVIFTGHSLGAARADFAAGFAMLNRGAK
jgi:hypothetical protein